MCAIFGVYGKEVDASRLTFFGLYALQHRGQESSGIASSDGRRISGHMEMGLVPQVFNEDTIKNLPGGIAIGHNRYSTANGSTLQGSQPILAGKGSLAFAHNGNLPSTVLLQSYLSKRGIDHSDMSDSKMMAEAIAAAMGDGLSLEDAIEKTYPLMTGAFSFLAMTIDTLVAVRDAYGMRPLSLGELDGSYVFSSETCAFHTIGAHHIGDVAPGEMVALDARGMRRKKLGDAPPAFDIFEFVYFARPDSTLLEKSVYQVRKRCGETLAKEYPLSVDVIIPIPETSFPSAIGYSQATGIPLEMGLIKNRYIHRTFIDPDQHIRDRGVKLKLTPLREVVAGKRIAIVDDSIVRGTTSRQIVRMLFEKGAREVHFLISSPPIRFPDFYGIDIPRQSELIAAQSSIEEIRAYLGATSLSFLSLEGLIAATDISRDRLCTSFFTGDYPIDLRERKGEVTYQSNWQSAKLSAGLSV